MKVALLLEGFVSVKNFAEKFRYTSFKESSLGLIFSKDFLADLKMSTFYMFLILHVLSSKYFLEGVGAFFTFLHPLIV